MLNIYRQDYTRFSSCIKLRLSFSYPLHIIAKKLAFQKFCAHMTILAISTVHTKICGLASMSSHVLKCACLVSITRRTFSTVTVKCQLI